MTPMDLTTLFVGALATARLTRLVTTDRISDKMRTWTVNQLLEADRANGLMMYLLECDWCVSIYLGAGVAAVLWLWPGAVWVAAALAFSYMAGFLASKEGE